MKILSIAETTLECPHCGSMYLHHGPVRVYDRTEDSPTVLKTMVRPGGGAHMEVVQNDRNNPSTRRHGLTVEFHCEACGLASHLGIAQHKGCTEIGWRD